MKTNFHTHTKRCGHAVGEDREYVEAAIAAGLHTLGFADHALFDFPNGYVSPWRGAPESYADYVDSINALKEEYRGRIELLVGWEMEYYPAVFDAALEKAKRYGVDYLILSHHAFGNEYDTWSEEFGAPKHACFPTDRVEDVVAYVDNLTAAMKYGVFSYVAHPDILNFDGHDATYRREMRRLCIAAREHDLPLEVNVSRMRNGGDVVAKDFFCIAKEEGNSVIIGLDAHTPKAFFATEAIETAKRLVRELELPLVDTIRLPLK